MGILYDQFGRAIEAMKRPETREIAVTTIRDRWSNYPSSGLTPQSLATIFKEADSGDVARQAELFEEMEEKDTHLFSEIQTRKNAVHGLDYEITPWSESAEDKRIRDFVADCLFSLESFDDALLDMLDAIGKGYSLNEIMWTTDSGKAVIGRIEWIHAKKAVFYERGAANMWAKSFEVPRIMTEAQPIEGEQMPAFKLIYHRYKTRSGYDTRAGVLRVCAWMYLFKNYSIKDWVAFAEVFGMPLRLGKYDQGASKADKDALVAAIQSLGSDAAGIISKSTEIEFVEAVKNSGTNNIYEALANFCDKQMSKAILGQTATTEGTPGKLGNEDAQDRVRHDLIKADAESLGKTIRHQILRPLVGYNFGWDKPLPWFSLLYERAEDLVSLMTVYKGASEIGQPISQEHVAERFKIPLPKKGEKVLVSPGDRGTPLDGVPLSPHVPGENTALVARYKPALSLSQGPNSGDRPGVRVVVASDGINVSQGVLTQAFTPDQQAVEGLKAEALTNWDAALAPMIDAVRQAIEEAADYEEAKAMLMAAYAKMDDAQATALLGRALFAADAWGRINGVLRQAQDDTLQAQDPRHD
jgi:phage gp29-like protein